MPPPRTCCATCSSERGFGPILDQLAKSQDASFWYVRPEASTTDVAELLRQALTLHFVTHVLLGERAAAQADLAAEPSETTFETLVAINAQIEALPGKEAAIDGFRARAGERMAAAV